MKTLQFFILAAALIFATSCKTKTPQTSAAKTTNATSVASSTNESKAAAGQTASGATNGSKASTTANATSTTKAAAGENQTQATSGATKTSATSGATHIQEPGPSLVTGNNKFAFELYKKISAKPENLFYSPFSISAALAMTYTGAKANTAKQISAVMHFADNSAAFSTSYKDYLATISKLNNDQVSIYAANSLWGQIAFTFKKEFIELISSNYSAEVKNVNFIKEADKCRMQINQWVESKTNSKIKDLIKPGLIDDLTRLVLVNAIYFKAPWDKPFDEKATKKLDFKKDDATTVTTDFMIVDNDYKYYSNDNLAAVEIPYSKGTMSMLVLLPKDKAAFEDLKKNIGNELYTQINSGLAMKKVKLFLPKFKATSEFELSDMLILMGMEEAFSDEADFSGMTGKKDLKISKVVHKAFIDVNEAGTEAAAATAVIIRIKSMPVNPVEFKADHPFMFIIKDNASGSILFAGNIYDPTK
jgi:serpin B